jgi:dipeptidyl-peptidase-4
LIQNTTSIMPPTLPKFASAILLFAVVTVSAAAADKPEDTSDAAVAAARQHRFEPVVRNIEGWTVHVDPKLLEGAHAEAGAEALKMLANHLQRIAILLPEKRLAEMRKLEIWIEHDHPFLNVEPGPYHPGAGWLTERGHDARLAKKVHITRAASLLERHHMVKHPFVVFHELVHSYHDQVLGFDEPRIKAAYERAMKEGLYDKVLLYTGRRVRAYAATNPMEYFAEGSEAYFYRNDFYPFVRAELKEHDPRLHELLVEIWGPLEPSR